MKIRSLKVKDFFILKDFKIEFNDNLSVLIGENGSGKSTILELIADIFGHLHKFFILGDKTAGFVENYEIVYDYVKENQSYTIEIHSQQYVDSKSCTFVPKIKINGEELSISQIEKKYGGMATLLPQKTILNYAGISDHLRTLSKHFEDKYIKKIIEANNEYTFNPLKLPNERPFIYIKQEHLSILTLSLFFSNDKRDAKFISEYLHIDKDNCGISIVLKEPVWAKKKEEKWWGASGNVALQFLNAMEYYADNETEDKAKKTLTYYFNGMVNLTTAMRELNADKKDIAFTIFDTLLYDDLLSEIIISWETDDGEEINVDRLSEGQKQVVQTLGVNYVFGDYTNVLYLYDEPDVFLHPRWQQEYVGQYQLYNDSSYVIITTHNPILIGNLKKEQIHEIHDGKEVKSTKYSEGRDINSILWDFFKVDKRSKKGQKLLKDFYDSMKAKDYALAKECLDKIISHLGMTDVATVKAQSLFDDLAE